MKHVIWAEILVHETEVANFLTKNNFKPNKFHLLEETGLLGRHTGYVRIIYVSKET